MNSYHSNNRKNRGNKSRNVVGSILTSPLWVQGIVLFIAILILLYLSGVVMMVFSSTAVAYKQLQSLNDTGYCIYCFGSCGDDNEDIQSDPSQLKLIMTQRYSEAGVGVIASYKNLNKSNQ